MTVYRLDDFENSCAAYDKALEITDDFFTHLNYAITLYQNDEVERARKHFAQFDFLYKKQTEEATDIDNDVKVQSELLRNVLY
jgi:Bardet-Biedl syndrome 4 protein